MILLIDNYDSFVHNLARYFRELGRETIVLRNDAISVADISADAYEAVVLSPGPCTPDEAGVCVPLLQSLPADLPVLGVCLGQQAIATAFGGGLRRVEPMHGMASTISHEGRGLFTDLPNPFQATRYHSLAVETPLPPSLQIDAVADDGLVMAISHRSLPIYGVQFHPEAVLTEHGYDLLSNFLRLIPPAKP
ncbi:MAG: aminodeoxychorismate/anthranilate synthase component II [Planctomycetota bacterium]|nr:aminodeoxychorismate/anthranilate synthase component II [Planctomycetaceae bacterium]MDQ3332367.1 aminodeoxychorismate/anthranilate synthase component II [Planctomycetota bacterium]